MDLGYHLPETSSTCYPSLMSPLSTFDKFKPASKSKGIFERLQADTELRLRARLNSVSTSKLIQKRSAVPIEDKLIRKGKEREIRLRHLIEQEELNRIQELQDRPYVSPNSKAILDGKYLNSSRVLKSRQIQSREIKEEVSNEKMQNNESIEKIVNEGQVNGRNFEDLKRNSDNSLKNYQKQLIKQLEHSYKLLCEKKKPKEPAFEVKCSDRKYVPNFAKQGDWKALLPKSSSLNSSSIFSKTSTSLMRKDVRPSSRLVAESAVGFKEALAYQQIIRNRVVNSIGK